MADPTDTTPEPDEPLSDGPGASDLPDWVDRMYSLADLPDDALALIRAGWSQRGGLWSKAGVAGPPVPADWALAYEQSGEYPTVKPRRGPSRLSPAIVRECVRLHAAGWTVTALAQAHGVSRRAIRKAIDGETYRDVARP